ncbi:hypothetical protein B188_08100 [Candidatus Brocadiaceae bacterium B188]|nr:hypothetical protein [Candidatus Brocadia sapporoensis]RZV58094.1 MAG: hypothetical protein EX330_07510 [Candidatus Brocadia sp. BROELEC01]TWU52849.1 hypothetical protein B188_08100 [Candidatus Brocadiaceae bacterium B188]
MDYFVPHRRIPCIPTVKHHIICQHQVEIEVFPATAEVYFQDERYEDPIDTQVRFSAMVYNAPTEKVKWHVVDLTGGTGAGTIDSAGLYTAPLKGGHPFTLTDIVVATSVDNPMRMAYARVAVIGRGPEPLPVKKLEIFPKTAFIYYPDPHTKDGPDNKYIDKSNTMQMFRTLIKGTDSTHVNWAIQDNADSIPAPPPVPVAGWDKNWYLYKLMGSGTQRTIRIIASLASDAAIMDEAIVIQLNYLWPGIV